METIKENIIEFVRKYECLYNTKHKDYKNKSYKLLLWEKIGTTLGIEGNKAKAIWRTLRDGYVRHKKQTVGKTGSGRKYNTYTWSAQMAFLDGTLELRPTSTNITAPQEAESESLESLISRQVSSLSSSSPQPGPSYAESPPFQWTPHTGSATELPLPRPCNAETPPPTGTPNTASSIQLPLSNSMHINQQTPTEKSSVKKRNNLSNKHFSEERTDNVLEYLQNKNRKRHEYDDIDHLFASYAKIFKKLSRRTQAELKNKLAKLFAEAEIRELDSDTETNKSPQSQLIYLPPAYSIISDESTQPIICAQEMSDAQVQQPIIAIDLSQSGQFTAEDLLQESAEPRSEAEEVSLHELTEETQN